jgi:hypothetical protein
VQGQDRYKGQTDSQERDNQRQTENDRDDADRDSQRYSEVVTDGQSQKARTGTSRERQSYRGLAAKMGRALQLVLEIQESAYVI